MKLPSLQNVVVGRPKLPTRVSVAAAVQIEDRLRLRKAAAWQWFMHGAGAEIQAPSDTFARRPSATQSRRQASRFSNEAASIAADVSGASYRPLDRTHDLAKSHRNLQGHVKDEEFSHSLRTEKLKPSNEDQEEEQCFHSFRTLREHFFEKEEAFSHEKMEPPNGKQKRRLHFLGFQKLLRKLTMSGRNRRNSNLPAPAAAVLPDEEEIQHHYHHYIHHHHHHYYHGGTAGSLEKVEVVTESRHGYIEHQRRRRHSESGLLCHQPELKLHYQEHTLEAEDEEGDEYSKVKGDSHALRRHAHNFSKEDPIQAVIGEVDTVFRHPLHRDPSLASARRRNSESFTTVPNVIKSRKM